MKILFIGDVVGTNGVNLLRKGLPLLKKEYTPDVIIVNGENANESGKGLNRRDADDIFACGADVIVHYFISCKKPSYSTRIRF